MADIKLRELSGKAEPNVNVDLNVSYNEGDSSEKFTAFSGGDGNFEFNNIVLSEAESGYINYHFSFVNGIGETIQSEEVRKFIDVDGPEQPPVITFPAINDETTSSFITPLRTLNVTGLAVPGNRIILFNSAFDSMFGSENVEDMETGIIVDVDETGVWEIRSIPLYADRAIEGNESVFNNLKFVQIDKFGIKGEEVATLKVSFDTSFSEETEEPEEPSEEEPLVLKRNLNLVIKKLDPAPSNFVELEWSALGLEEGISELSHFDIWYTKKNEVSWRKHNKQDIHSEKYQASGLEPDTKYVFQLIAVANDGTESYDHTVLGWNEVSSPSDDKPDRESTRTGRKIVKDKEAPGTPHDLRVVRTKGSSYLQFRWNFFPEIDLNGFFIYESQVSPENSTAFNQQGGWDTNMPLDITATQKALVDAVPIKPAYSAGEILGNQISFNVPIGVREGVYFYTVRALDTSGNYSEFCIHKNIYIGEQENISLSAPKAPEMVSAIPFKDIIDEENVPSVKLTFKVIEGIGKYRIYRSSYDPSVVSEFQSWGESLERVIPSGVLEVMPEDSVYEYIDRNSDFNDEQSDGLGLGEYFYSVKAVSEVGEEEFESLEFSDYIQTEITEEIAYPDVEPPQEATSVLAKTTSAQTPIENELTWVIGSDEDLKGYRIYRSKKNPADFDFDNPDSWEWEVSEDDEETGWKFLTRELENKMVGLPTVGNKIVYQDSNSLVNEQIYYYNVQAVDKFGNYSNKIVSVTVPQDNTYLEVIEPPSSLFAFAKNTRVELQWRDNKNYPAGTKYFIYRSLINPAETTRFSEEDLVLVAGDIPQAISGNYIVYYDQSNISNGVTYFYALKAKATGDNESKYSEWVSAVPDAEVEEVDVHEAPEVLKVFVNDANYTELTWVADYDKNVAGYNVFRSEIHPGDSEFVHPGENSEGRMDIENLGSWTLLSKEDDDSDVLDTLVGNPSAGEICLFVDDQTSPDKDYYYVVHTVGDSNSVSLFSKVYKVYRPALSETKPTPSGVEGFKVFNNSQGLQLKWQRNAELTSIKSGYRIYKSKNNTDPGGDEFEGWERVEIDQTQYSTLDDFTVPQTLTGLVLSYIDKDVEDNVIYFYTVVSTNEFGKESEFSLYVELEKVPIEQTSTTPPAIPTGARVIVVDGPAVEIKWKKGTESDLAGYNLYKSSLPEGHVSFGDWGLELNGPLTEIRQIEGSEYVTFTDDGVAAGETWYYAVEAVDEAGNQSSKLHGTSMKALIPSSSLVASKPKAPTAVKVVSQNGKIVLEWPKVWYNEDNTLIGTMDGYQIYVSNVDPARSLEFQEAGGWTKLIDDLVPQVVSGLIVQYQDDDVEVGKTYFYTVTAKSSDNGGVESEYANFGYAKVISSVGDIIPPDKPRSGSVEIIDEGVKISWAPGSEEDLEGYNVYRSSVDGDDPGFGQWGIPLNGTFNYLRKVNGVELISFVDEDVVEGQTWYYAVEAVDESGNSSEFLFNDLLSATIEDVSTAKTPKAPANIFGVAGNASAVIQWSKVVKNSDETTMSDFQQYIVKRSSVDPSRSLEFQESGWEDIETGIPQPGAGSVVELEDTGLTNDETYYYTVVVRNESGNVSEVVDYIAVTPKGVVADTTPPIKPSGGSARVMDDGNVEIKWLLGSDEDLHGYNVYRSSTEGTPSTDWGETVNDALNFVIGAPGTTLVSFIDENVSAGETWYYAIEAVDKSGNGSELLYNDALKVTNPFLEDIVAPKKVQNLFGIAGSTEVTVQWSAVTKNADNSTMTDFEQYMVYRSEVDPALSLEFQEAGGWQIVESGIPQPGAGSVVQYIDDGLSNDMTYHYMVIARDEAGNESEISEYVSITPVSGIVDTTPPVKPLSGSAIVLEDQTVNVKWALGIDSDLHGYNVYRSNTPSPVDWGEPLNGTLNFITGIPGVTFVSYIDSDVSIGQTWYYAIEAVDESGNKSDKLYGTVLGVTIPAAADALSPRYPAGLIPTVESGKVTLSWFKVTTNSDGSPLTDFAGYQVLRSEDNPALTFEFGGWESIHEDLVPQVTSGNIVQFEDDTVVDDTTYYYTVISKDDSGNESSKPQFVEATPVAVPDTTSPAKPIIESVNITSGNLEFYKNNTDDDLAGFYVYSSLVDPTDPSFVAPDAEWNDTGSWERVKEDLWWNGPENVITVNFPYVELFDLYGHNTPGTEVWFTVVAVDKNNNISDSADVESDVY